MSCDNTGVHLKQITLWECIFYLILKIATLSYFAKLLLLSKVREHKLFGPFNVFYSMC